MWGDGQSDEHFSKQLKPQFWMQLVSESTPSTTLGPHSILHDWKPVLKAAQSETQTIALATNICFWLGAAPAGADNKPRFCRQHVELHFDAFDAFIAASGA